MPSDMKTKRPEFSAPKHLKPQTRRWFSSVCDERVVEPHHVRVLQVAGELWDRKEAARSVLETNGLTYQDRFGCPRPRPEVAMVRDAELGFLRAVRELGLDAEDSPEA